VLAKNIKPGAIGVKRRPAKTEVPPWLFTTLAWFLAGPGSSGCCAAEFGLRRYTIDRPRSHNRCIRPAIRRTSRRSLPRGVPDGGPAFFDYRRFLARLASRWRL